MGLWVFLGAAILFIASLVAASLYAAFSLSKHHEDKKQEVAIATIVIGNWTMVFGLLGMLAITGWSYGLTGDFGKDFWSTLGTDAMVAIASAAVGALLGFIFGVPRTLVPASQAAAAAAAKQAGQTASARAHLGANTNLERISDWLTTLLIGATLVQSQQVLGWIGELGNRFDGTLTNKMVVPVIVIYFCALSFLGIYLITRLYLATALGQVDLESSEPTTKVPTITTTTLPDGQVGTAYPATTIAATGGTPPLTWSVSPALPTGLTLNTADGTVSGTPTAAASRATYTFTVTDSAPQPASATVDIAFEIAQGAAAAAPTITTTTLPDGQVGTAYPATTIAATGGTPPLTWSVSPALPTGLTLNTADGTVSGTPTAAASRATYTFTVTDSAPQPASATVDIAFEIAQGAAAVTDPVPPRAMSGS